MMIHAEKEICVAKEERSNDAMCNKSAFLRFIAVWRGEFTTTRELLNGEDEHHKFVSNVNYLL